MILLAKQITTIEINITKLAGTLHDDRVVIDLDDSDESEDCGSGVLVDIDEENVFGHCSDMSSA